MKKRIIHNKPDIGDFGHYVFFEDGATEYSQSNSVPNNSDKFTDKDLYTLQEGNTVNDTIIKANLRYPGTSYISIDELNIEMGGVNHDVKDTGVWVYLFDDAGYYHHGCEEDCSLGTDGINNAPYWDIKGISDIPGAIDPFNRIWEKSWEHHTNGDNLGDIIKNSVVLEGLYEDKYYDEGWSANGSSAYNPDMAFAGVTNQGGPALRFGENQYIFIVVLTAGDAEISMWPDFNRDNRIQVFTIDVDNDLMDPDGADGGGLTPLEWGYSESHIVEGGGDGTPAWKVAKLRVSVNTVRESDIESFDEEMYDPEGPYFHLKGIIQPRSLISENNFNFDFLFANPNRDIGIENLSIMETDFIASTDIKVPNNTQYDLQAYQTSSLDRQIASAPMGVSYNVIINKLTEPGQSLELFEQVHDEPHKQGTNYIYYVLDWNDLDDKFKDWDDVFANAPTNELELLDKQKEGLYNFHIAGQPTIYTYKTPGIKIIKAIVFSYRRIDSHRIVPVRWKFIKSKLFLDIPINLFPDFAELGGADYTTIPWPNVTPIIGGISENSKYKISVQDTLSGGKMGEADIIDEIFLNEAIENDELGQTITKFDLEQLRYFNDCDGGDCPDLTNLLLLEDSPYFMDSSNNLIDVPISEFGGTQGEGYWTTGDWGTGQPTWFNIIQNSHMNTGLFTRDTGAKVGLIADWWRKMEYSEYTPPDSIFEITSDGDRTNIQRVYDYDGSDQRAKGIRIIKPYTGYSYPHHAWGSSPYSFQYDVTKTYRITFDARASTDLIGMLRTDTMYSATNIPGSTYTYTTEWQTFTFDWTPSDAGDGGTAMISNDWLIGFYTTEWGEYECINYVGPNHGDCDAEGPYISSGDWFEIDNVDLRIVEEQTDSRNSIENAIAPNGVWPITGDGGDIEKTNVTTPWGTAGTKIVASADPAGQNSNNIFFDRQVGGDGEVLITFPMVGGETYRMEFKYKIYGTDLTYWGNERVPTAYISTRAYDSVTDTSYSTWYAYGNAAVSNKPILIEELEDDWKHVYYTWTVPDVPLETDPVFGENSNAVATWDDITNFRVMLRSSTIDFIEDTEDIDLDDAEDNVYGLSNYNAFAIADVVLTKGDMSNSYSFSEETSVGQIFISDNIDSELKENCKLEFNCGNLDNKIIQDSSGNSNKGLLIGDYKIKKTRKNKPMKRDSYIKIPKKNSNSNGAM